VRLDAEQAGRVAEHRARVGLGKAFALEDHKQDFSVRPRHVSVGLALAWLVAEVPPAVDHLLG
jgi:hypothetical protein